MGGLLTPLGRSAQLQRPARVMLLPGLGSGIATSPSPGSNAGSMLQHLASFPRLVRPPWCSSVQGIHVALWCAGVLQGTQQTQATKTLTHTLWALYNVLPANSVQPPHRHAATALDLAEHAPEGRRPSFAKL